MEQSPTDPRDPLLGEDSASQRDGSRDSLLLTGLLRVADDAEISVLVRNLSSGGLMAEYAPHVAQGTPVEIEVRGLGRVGGRIAWATEGRIGIAFDRKVDPMAARKPVAPGRPARVQKPKPVRRAV